MLRILVIASRSSAAWIKSKIKLKTPLDSALLGLLGSTGITQADSRRGLGQCFAFGKSSDFLLLCSPEWSCIGRVLIAFLEIKAAGTGAVCWSLLPPGAAHQPALPPACTGKSLTWRASLPRDPQACSIFQSLILLSKREVLQRHLLLWRVYLMPMLGTKHTQNWLQGGEEEQWDAGNGKEMEKWENLTCDRFSTCVILCLLLLNAGQKPFRRMWSTTLQHFPLLPGASAECRAAFGGTEMWGALTSPPSTPTAQPVPPEGGGLTSWQLQGSITPLKQPLLLLLHVNQGLSRSFLRELLPVGSAILTPPASCTGSRREVWEPPLL